MKKVEFVIHLGCNDGSSLLQSLTEAQQPTRIPLRSVTFPARATRQITDPSSRLCAMDLRKLGYVEGKSIHD